MLHFLEVKISLTNKMRLDMQANIVTGTLRLVMLLSCMMMVIMMPMMATASSSKPPLLPAPSMASASLRPQQEMHRGEEQYQVQPEILPEDYGISDPPPNIGRGAYAPILH